MKNVAQYNGPGPIPVLPRHKNKKQFFQSAKRSIEYTSNYTRSNGDGCQKELKKGKWSATDVQ